MSTKKFPNVVYEVAKQYCSKCPLSHKIHTGIVQRVSKTSLTMECKKCGLRWQMTWKSIFVAMGKSKKRGWRDSNYELRREVNVIGVKRYDLPVHKARFENYKDLETFMEDALIK